MQNNDEDRKLEKRLEVIQGSDGSGIHRKLRLGPGLKKDNPRSVIVFFFNFVKLLLFYTSVCNNLVDFFLGCSPGTPAIPAATHEFAALCLKNALHLLPEDPLTAEKVPIEDSDTV